MNKNIFLINKKLGETPLEALETFRLKKKISKETPMTYAGRLDPMAEGLLVILTGDECKDKQKYLNLDKEYTFEVFFGFSTDTYDILGKIKKNNKVQIDKKELEKKIKQNLKFFTGKFIQKYPMYSSKTVKGKPLFVYARDGKDVKIPERGVNVKSLKFLGIKKITKKKLLENVTKKINKVNGDFRQKEILKIWKNKLSKERPSLYLTEFKIKCSSGTYVRGIANNLGEKLDIPAIAYSIKRTKVGKWSL